MLIILEIFFAARAVLKIGEYRKYNEGLEYFYVQENTESLDKKDSHASKESSNTKDEVSAI